MHIEYAPVPFKPDVQAGLALIEESGHASHEFELISVDDDWRRNAGERLQTAAGTLRNAVDAALSD